MEGAAGALAGSLPDPASPDIQDETHYVKCELLTQEAVRAKMQEMDAAMAQLHVTPPTGAWAFLKSNPGANLPSLEMLGSLLLASFLMEEGVRNRLQFRISLISDSQGNVAEPLDPEDANGYGSDATGPLSTRPPHSHRCDWGQAPWALISLSAQDGGLDSFFTLLQLSFQRHPWTRFLRVPGVCFPPWLLCESAGIGGGFGCHPSLTSGEIDQHHGRKN